MKFTGLDNDEVVENRKKYGKNGLPEKEPVTFWSEFKETFSDPMIKLLLIVAAISIVMFFFGYSELYEPIGIGIAILIVAFVSAKTNVANDRAFYAQNKS